MKHLFAPEFMNYEMPVRTMDAVTVFKQCEQPPPIVCNCCKPKGFFKRIGCALKALFGNWFKKKAVLIKKPD
jgi:hypothetical protein